MFLHLLHGHKWRSQQCQSRVRGLYYSLGVQWNHFKVDSIGTTAACLEYGGIHNLEASIILPVCLELGY